MKAAEGGPEKQTIRARLSPPRIILYNLTLVLSARRRSDEPSATSSIRSFLNCHYLLYGTVDDDVIT